VKRLDDAASSDVAANAIQPAANRGNAPIAAASIGTSVVRWPMKNPGGPLQFWRLTRKLELQRGHGRLLIHGNGYWK
jgi:hypothetical protein